MANRDFSDSVKLSVITENLRKNNGDIRCAICRMKLSSISECHFDHIFPFAKGGKSTANNCQILCTSCNLKKADKELHDFLLEEKARKFLSGVDSLQLAHNGFNVEPSLRDNKTSHSVVTKEVFDQAISKCKEVLWGLSRTKSSIQH